MPSQFADNPAAAAGARANSVRQQATARLHTALSEAAAPAEPVLPPVAVGVAAPPEAPAVEAWPAVPVAGGFGVGGVPAPGPGAVSTFPSGAASS